MQGRARLRLVAIVLGSLLALACMGSRAWAAPGAVQLLPGCDTQLEANDDSSTDAVPLGFTADFGDAAADEVYVNNNGNVTFGQPLGDYTPYDFRGSNIPMIAPYFADVDTRGAGTVKYGAVTYDGEHAFCVTWDQVGYYDARTDKRDTFQLIIVDRGAAGVDLVFNYDAMQWETGEADDGVDGLGGTSATAGYSTGDGNPATAFLFPGSFVNGALIDGGPHSLAAGASTGQPAGRYVFRVAPAPGSRLSGRVLAPAAPAGDGSPQSGAPVQICRQGGSCVTRIADADGRYLAGGLAAGTYDLTAFAGEEAPYTSGSATVTVDGSAAATQDIVLGAAPSAPPAGTTITSIDTTPQGIPVAYWEDPLTLTTQGCPGGTATYTVHVGATVRTGAMTEGAAGAYSATLTPFYPAHGNAEVQIHIDCPGGAPDDDVDFGLYIDPSGIVRDAAGHPAAGATVTLLSSTTPDGPFFPVPDGSTVMSPSNRNNPDVTRDDGRFAWDVVAGYYVVRATRGNCSAQSAVLTIPPPVTNLDLRLACPAGGGTPPPSGGGTVVPPPSSGGPVVIAPPPTVAKKTQPPKLATIRSARLVHGRRLAVKVACARSASRACAGTVTARVGKRTIGRRAFKRLKPGKQATIVVKLTAKGRALVSRAHGKKPRITVTVTVRDGRGAGRPMHRTVKVGRR